MKVKRPSAVLVLLQEKITNQDLSEPMEGSKLKFTRCYQRLETIKHHQNEESLSLRNSFLFFLSNSGPSFFLYFCNISITVTTTKTEVESVQLGNTYFADMDKCPHDKCCLDKCRGDSCNLLYMFPGPFV